MTMMWLLLSFHLITSVWPFPVVVSPTYQTVEDNNITIGWDFHTTTDLSLTKLVCVLLSKPPKVLYEMRNGVEVPESPHQQFTGRVQLDKDALRGGRFRLDLSTVTAEDSGNYRCEVVANYDKTRSTWEFDASETFVLNVNQVADEDNSDVSVNTETSGAETTQGLKTWDYIQLAGLIGALLATVVAAVGKLLYDNPPKKGPEAHVDLLAAEAKQKLRI